MRSEPYGTITVAITVSNCLSLCAVPPAGAAESPYLVDNWNGNRPRLADESISFYIGYDSEAAHKSKRLARHSWTASWSWAGRRRTKASRARDRNSPDDGEL